MTAPANTKLEPAATRRETLRPPVRRDRPARATLPDQAVVRVLDVGRVAFTRCFERATTADPLAGTLKVQLRIDLDAMGRVTRATSDADVAGLSRCLERVAHALPFPAPGRPATVGLPLHYRAQ